MSVDETTEEWVRRTRAEQGLGPKVTDPVVLARVVELLWPVSEGGPDDAS